MSPRVDQFHTSAVSRVPAGNAHPSSSIGVDAGNTGGGHPPASSRHLSIVGGSGGSKGYPMRTTGTVAVRCETCGQLGFDWRTGVCLDHEEES